MKLYFGGKKKKRFRSHHGDFTRIWGEGEPAPPADSRGGRSELLFLVCRARLRHLLARDREACITVPAFWRRAHLGVLAVERGVV